MFERRHTNKVASVGEVRTCLGVLVSSLEERKKRKSLEDVALSDIRTGCFPELSFI